MASFNPKECKPGVFDFDTNIVYSWVRKFGLDCWKKTGEPDVAFKLPLRKFEPTLRKFTQIVVPTDLDRLKRHQANMEKHLRANAWNDLNVEQINASRTVQQLRATVRDLENTRQQIQDSDLQEFDTRVAKVKNDVSEAIRSFSSLEHELLQKMRELSVSSSSTNDISNNIENRPRTSSDHESFPRLQTQVQATYSDENAAAAAASWNDLRESLVDLNGMINEFSNLVSQQQEQIDSISDNVDRAHTNVQQGVMQLAHANKYKAAVIPMAGAVVGGLVGGPIGLIAGFKLAGVATAVGGGLLGWQGAKYLKRRRDEHIDVELTKLSDPDCKGDSNKLKNA